MYTLINNTEVLNEMIKIVVLKFILFSNVITRFKCVVCKKAHYEKKTDYQKNHFNFKHMLTQLRVKR